MNTQENNFDDFLQYVFSVSSYTLSDLLDFKEHFQNLISHEDNYFFFVKWYNEQQKQSAN